MDSAVETAPRLDASRTLEGRSRNFGLDLARALAIAFVLAAHTVGVVVTEPSRARLAVLTLGMVGVEIFFSLSGFLIGRILIALARGGVTAGSVLRFLGRRWFRTLPMYYVSWLVMSALLGVWNWRDLLFLQSFSGRGASVLVVSWSLVMEEWFYLLFPLLMLGAVIAARQRRLGAAGVLGVALALVLLCTALRLAAALGGFAPGSEDFQQNPILRLDCAAYGVLAAVLDDALRRGHGPGWIGRVTDLPAQVAAACLAFAWAALAMAAEDPGFREASGMVRWPPGYHALKYAVFDFAFAILVLGLSRRLPRGRHGISEPVELLSWVSYSVYLVHVPILTFWAAPVTDTLGRAWGSAALVAIVLVVACGTWGAVERPFLILRDRLIQ